MNASGISITFKTTSNDKDWNTQIRVRVRLGGVDVATLDCCSGDRKDDHFDDGSTKTRQLSILQPIAKGSLAGQGKLYVGIVAKGDDTWAFDPTLDLSYPDGTTEQWSFGELTLNSIKSSEAGQELPISTK